jgi:type IV fimbrial biogenesis protein FimT
MATMQPSLPFRVPGTLRHTTAPKDLRGFTLTEVLVVIAIMGILAALAGPSFIPIIERWRVRQAVENMTSTIYYARSEAIKRGGQVAIQKLPNNTNGCTTASNNQDWDCGWFVCADTNDDNTCDASEPVLQRYDAPANVQITRTGGGASIKINRWGLVDGAWLGFSLVPLNKSTTDQAARGLCMSSGGRLRVIPPESIPCTG